MTRDPSVISQGTFAELLRSHREAAGLSQEALSARSGLTAEAISMLERGVRRAPRPSTVSLLAEALRLTPDDRREFSAAARSRRPIVQAAVAPQEPAPVAVASRWRLSVGVAWLAPLLKRIVPPRAKGRQLASIIAVVVLATAVIVAARLLFIQQHPPTLPSPRASTSPGVSTLVPSPVIASATPATAATPSSPPPLSASPATPPVAMQQPVQATPAPQRNLIPPASLIICSVLRMPPSAYQVMQSGSYAGPGTGGQQCDGRFSYTSTPTTATAAWPWPVGLIVPDSYPMVYIPNAHATAIVDYIAMDCGGSTRVLAQGVRQTAQGGWVRIGGSTRFSGCLKQVLIQSNEEHVDDMAAAAFGFLPTGA